MGALTALGLGAVAIPTEFIVERRRWWPAGIAATTAVAFLAVAASETRYSDHHPRRVNLYYVMDADAQKANWAARVNRTDAWTGQFLGACAEARAGRRRSCRRGRRSMVFRDS